MPAHGFRIKSNFLKSAHMSNESLTQFHWLSIALIGFLFFLVFGLMYNIHKNRYEIGEIKDEFEKQILFIKALLLENSKNGVLSGITAKTIEEMNLTPELFKAFGYSDAEVDAVFSASRVPPYLAITTEDGVVVDDLKTVVYILNIKTLERTIGTLSLSVFERYDTLHYSQSSNPVDKYEFDDFKFFSTYGARLEFMKQHYPKAYENLSSFEKLNTEARDREILEMFKNVEALSK